MRRLVVLALLLVVAAPAQSRTGRALVVRAAADGAPGSLRDLVEHEARAGDTITFGSFTRIELRNRLVFGKELAGLTLDGTIASGGNVELAGVKVRAAPYLQAEPDRLVLRRLKLTNLPVAFATATDGGTRGPRAVRVLDVETTLFQGSVRPALEFSFARDFQVVGGRIGGGIVATSTRTGLIKGVTLRGGGNAIDDIDSRDLLILENVLETGRITLKSLNVTVRENRLRPGTRMHVWIPERGSGRVVDNIVQLDFRAGGIIAEAGGLLEVSGNTLTGAGVPRGAPGPQGIVAGCPSVGDGRLVISRNTVTKLRIGLSLECNRELQVTVQRNTLTDNSLAGIVVKARGVRLERNTVVGNGVGVDVKEGEARLVRDTVRDNRGPGIRVAGEATATITRIVTGSNDGLGIARSGTPPPPRGLKHDTKLDKLRGNSCAGCTIEVYEAEEGDEAGEGIRFLGTVKAGGDGSFIFPGSGSLNCPKSGRLTATATDARRRTSAFSADLVCSCIASADFAIDPKQVPKHGFFNFGLSFGFRDGSTVGEAKLTEKRSGKRPSATALGPLLQWQEFLDKPGPPASFLGPGHFTRDYFARVTYRDSQAPGDATGSRVVWRYSIPYEPPRGVTDCGGKLVGATLPVRGG